MNQDLFKHLSLDLLLLQELGTATNPLLDDDYLANQWDDIIKVVEDNDR